MKKKSDLDNQKLLRPRLVELEIKTGKDERLASTAPKRKIILFAEADEIDEMDNGPFLDSSL